MRERTSREEVALFIPNGQPVQYFDIEDTLIRRERRPEDLLSPGEVALFTEINYQGEVYILRNNFSNFSKVIGLDESISSVKVGPGTGVTLFSDAGFQGDREDILQDLDTMTGTDIGGDNISSIQIWDVVPLSEHGIRSKTGLRKSYRSLPEGGVEEFNSYPAGCGICDCRCDRIGGY